MREREREREKCVKTSATSNIKELEIVHHLKGSKRAIWNFCGSKVSGRYSLFIWRLHLFPLSQTNCHLARNCMNSGGHNAKWFKCQCRSSKMTAPCCFQIKVAFKCFYHVVLKFSIDVLVFWVLTMCEIGSVLLMNGN